MIVRSEEGVTLNVQVAGTVPPVDGLIAIHGGPGLDDYTGSLERLAGDDFSVVRYEQRGVGRSSAPPGAGFALSDYIADLEAVFRAVSGPGATLHLLGHSFGGLVAMAYAAFRPERVGRLVLAASVPPTGAEL